jgi:hypothetical protein
MKITLDKKTIENLWWLIISVDYDYSRISIADHNITDDGITIWLEDKNDFKNTIDECLELFITRKNFSNIIKADNLNSYEGTKMHPTKNFVYKARIEINEPIKWYNEDASNIEQQWAREAILKNVLIQIVENEISSTNI